MTFKDIVEWSPSAVFYNYKDKLINHIYKRSFEQFDISDILRNNVKTKEDFLKYQEECRKTLKEITGEVPYDKNLPLNAKITGKNIEDEIEIENIIFNSRENIYVTATLFLPQKRKGKIPAVIMQMGHSADGRLNDTYQKVARIHAKAGLAVFAFDPVGQGERLSYIDKKTGEVLVNSAAYEHQYFGAQCFLAGNVPVKYFLCDAMRAIDYLETREEIDKEKIGATGTSGGGTMTSVLMAYDERIKAASPSCFLTTRRAYYYAGGNQDSEQIWVGGTKKHFDHYELVSCFCPKPLLILSVSSDFFPLEGTVELFEKEKEFYCMFDKKDNLNMYISDSEHAYTLEAAAQSAMFFSKHLLGENKKIEPVWQSNFDTSELFSTKCGKVIEEFSDAKIIFDENLSDYNKASAKTYEEKKSFFENKVYSDRENCRFFLKKFATPDCDGFKIKRYMWYSQPNLPCYGIMISYNEANPVKICLFENGTNDIINYLDEIKRICNEGYQAFVIDTQGCGKCEPYDLNYGRVSRDNLGVMDKLTKDLFFIDDSLCAMKTYDVLRAVELVKNELNINEVSLFATGLSSVFSRIVEILKPDIKTEYKDEIKISDIVTSEYYNIHNISDILMPELALYLK